MTRHLYSTYKPGPQGNTVRPESPFKSKAKKKQSRSRPPSPPCTCDEDMERPASSNRVLEHHWDRGRSESKMSRASTRMVGNGGPPGERGSLGGFSSLASSAFQMPDNVFGTRRELASDTISLEALSPRPRSRSRSRSKSGRRRRSSSSRLLMPPASSTVQLDYHYHHELDRCRSFLEGSLEQHMEFCKCTCDEGPRTIYDNEYLAETKLQVRYQGQF